MSLKRVGQLTALASVLPTDVFPVERDSVLHKAPISSLVSSLGVFDIRLYGASTGSADNSLAIQDAIDAAGAAGGGVVFVPDGTFITRERSLLENVRMAGNGPTRSILKLYDGANESILNTTSVSNCGIRDLGFDGNNANQSSGDFQVVVFTDCNDLDIDNIRIDRGTDATKGTYSGPAGLYIDTCLRFRAHGVEVTGDGVGYGIWIADSAKFELVSPYVHDMVYDLVADPGNDRMDGIAIDGSAEFIVDKPRVHDLGGDYGSGATTRYTRGMNFGQCNGFMVHAPNIARVDQGIDLTGGDPGNTVWEIHGGYVKECLHYCYKFANSARHGLVTGCVADRAGSACFVANGPSGAGITVATGNIDFVNCVAYDPGFFDVAATHIGFKIEINVTFSPDDPRGFRFIGCRAEDRQDVPTMVYGFYNETPANTDGRYNEAIDCVSIGHITAAFRDMHSARCEVSRGAVQPITHDTWTAVDWTADVDLGAMHSTSSNNDQVVARREGTYRSAWGAVFAANGAGQRGVRITRNGAAVPGTTVLAWPAAGGQTALHTSWSSSMGEGDILRLEVFQDSGGDLDLQTTSGGVVEQVT